MARYKNDEKAIGNAMYVTNVYDSLDALADAAVKRIDAMPRKAGGLRGYTYDEWAPGTFDETVRLCHDGWDVELDRVIEIAEDAVRTVMEEHNAPAPLLQYDVTGESVDMGRFMSGVPECMLDFPIQETSTTGKVVTLIASVDVYGGVSADQLYKRGIGITAFAMALTRLGHAVEFWVDVFCNDPKTDYSDMVRRGGYVRAMVKGPNDTLDPSKLLFAYCHSGVMRHIGMAITHAWPSNYKTAMGMEGPYSYGPVGLAPHDMEEGTIYLPSVQPGVDLTNPSELITHYLTELGLLRGE